MPSTDFRARDDRVVHATISPVSGPRIEIVRYDRSGKFYYESGKERRQITLAEAVAFAVPQRPAVIWHERALGGTRFDAAVRKARAAK